MRLDHGKEARQKPRRLTAKLLLIRKSLGMTQIELSEELDFPAYCRFSEYESGRREPSVLLLLRYARLANIPLEALVDDEMDLPPI